MRVFTDFTLWHVNEIVDHHTPPMTYHQSPRQCVPAPPGHRHHLEPPNWGIRPRAILFGITEPSLPKTRPTLDIASGPILTRRPRNVRTETGLRTDNGRFPRHTLPR
ncbi:MAG: hypothetical protein Ct9H300mP16_09070 [Pseudomonadota bacterium]|nr:MAG: hypothetical protein Ct9H300mP16_09070 [Pseudomonadota bacterium]